MISPLLHLLSSETSPTLFWSMNFCSMV
jgi:hypothetical protein